MNQLLIVLCLIAGTWYLVSANLKNDQDGIPLSEVSAPAPTSVEQYKTDPTSSEHLNSNRLTPSLSNLVMPSYLISPLRRWWQDPNPRRNRHSSLSRKSGLHRATGFR